MGREAGQSSETESLTCGICYNLQVNSGVRSEFVGHQFVSAETGELLEVGKAPT